MSLCYRCEHRAIYHETSHGPRCECKDTSSVSCCYMYKPVKPVRLKRTDGDKRPLGGAPILSARAEYDGVPEMVLDYVGDQSGLTMYWRPE